VLCIKSKLIFSVNELLTQILKHKKGRFQKKPHSKSPYNGSYS